MELTGLNDARAMETEVPIVITAVGTEEEWNHASSESSGAGCATIESLQPGTGTGTTIEIEGRSYEAIWRAAVRTAGRSLTIVESDKPRGTIKAGKGAGAATRMRVAGTGAKCI